MPMLSSHNRWFHSVLFLLLFVTVLSAAGIKTHDTSSTKRITVKDSTLQFDGKQIFLSGANLPWVQYGDDFGNNQSTSVRQSLENAVNTVASAGGNSIRIWLFVEGQSIPEYDNAGKVTGTDKANSLVDDLLTFVRYAATHNVIVNICLWNGALMRDERTKNLVKNPELLQTFLDNSLTPIVIAMKNEPNVIYEVMNEPEGSVAIQKDTESCFDTTTVLSGSGAGWSGANLAMKDLLRFHSLHAFAIHSKDPEALVTVGSWSEYALTDTVLESGRKFFNYYSDECLMKASGLKGSAAALATLDFYQLHTYPSNGKFHPGSPMSISFAKYNVTKPLIIGEFGTTKCSPACPVETLYTHAINSGYSGSWDWSLKAADGQDNAQTAVRGMSAIKDDARQQDKCSERSKDPDVTLQQSGEELSLLEKGSNINIDVKKKKTKVKQQQSTRRSQQRNVLNLANASPKVACLARSLHDAIQSVDLNSFNQPQERLKNLEYLTTEIGGIENLLVKLKVDGRRGLRNNKHDPEQTLEVEIEARQRVYGPNILPDRPMKPYLLLVWDALCDTTLIILIVAALVSLGVGLYEDPVSGYIEGVAILAAVTLVTLITATNDYTKEIKFRALQSKGELKKSTVIRNGEERECHVEDIVVGDLVALNEGDKVPCDGVLLRLDGGTLAMDEAPVTGESDLVKKSLPVKTSTSSTISTGAASSSTVSAGAAPEDMKEEVEEDSSSILSSPTTTDSPKPPPAGADNSPIPCWSGDPFLISGTAVSEGAGVYIATAVGEESQWGQTRAKLLQDAKLTPLQERLDEMAQYIAYIGFGAALLTFIALVIVWFVRPDIQADHTASQYFIDAVIICVTIIVVAIPEGLPLAVTISLAYSSSQMARDQCLIRKLEACETMGNATTICSDKTGTLTQNMMTVVEACVLGTKTITIESSTSGHGEISPTCTDCTSLLTIYPDESFVEQIWFIGVAVNSKANLAPAISADRGYHVKGNKTEGALL
eukprot:g2901.t1